MNTDVADLLHESIDRLTDGARVPAGLADRAVRRNRQRQLTLGTAAATGTALLATAAVLLATAVIGGVPRATGTLPARTTAYVVSRTERALTAAEQGRVIQEAHVALQGGRFAMSPNARFIAEAPRAVFWSYLGQFRDEGLTAAGMAVYNANAIYVPAGQQRTVQATGVEYRFHRWWRVTVHVHLGLSPSPRECARVYLPPPMGIQINWPVEIRRALSCARYRVAGRQWVDGIHAIKIVSVAPAKVPAAPAKVPALAAGNSTQTFWVDPATYLPVRALWAWSPVHGEPSSRMTGDFRWLTATRAHLSALHVTVPSGFRRVRDVAVPDIGMPASATPARPAGR
jgi:hypothetical protein